MSYILRFMSKVFGQSGKLADQSMFAGVDLADAQYKGVTLFQILMSFIYAVMQTDLSIVSGTITISDSATTGTHQLDVTSGSAVHNASSIAIAILQSKTGGPATASVVMASVSSGGLLTVTLDAAPGTGKSVKVAFIVDSRGNSPSTWWEDTKAKYT